MIGSIFHRNWGVIEKCPHCDRTNIPKVNKQQFTCGSVPCRAKQNQQRMAERKARNDNHRVQAHQ